MASHRPNGSVLPTPRYSSGTSAATLDDGQVETDRLVRTTLGSRGWRSRLGGEVAFSFSLGRSRQTLRVTLQRTTSPYDRA
jgi:hypothetical protein